MFVIFAPAISAIPKIVCETIHALELQDECPSWKIMDNKGRVTVVLHWDQQRKEASPQPLAGAQGRKQPSLVIQTSVDSQTGKKRLLSTIFIPQGTLKILWYFFPKLQIRCFVGAPGFLAVSMIYFGHFDCRYQTSPQITVINHDEQLVREQQKLVRGGGSFEGQSSIHVHTPECANHAHMPQRSGSPGNSNTECDFHCCSLHEEGRKIAVHKSVATSPIQDSLSASPSPHHPRGRTVKGTSPTNRQPPIPQPAPVHYPHSHSHVYYDRGWRHLPPF